MADERDSEVSRRYRELGAEEPPRALDEKILAASRRAVGSHPAPLVAPAGRRRWYFPLAAAAVIMLAVTVTLQIERQKPDDEIVASALPRARKEEKAITGLEQPKPAPKPQRAPAQFTPEPPPAAAPPSADALRDLAKSTANAPAEARARNDATQERAAAASGVRRAMESSPPQASAPMSAAGSAQLQSRAMETPEIALERIAELRKQGKHEEADKALAEFRKRYPDYRLSDEMRVKVERRQ